jgi:hypothetical protein
MKRHGEEKDTGERKKAQSRLDEIDLLRWEEELWVERITYERVSYTEIFPHFQSTAKETQGDVPHFVMLAMW